jgi:anion-transporting  ArsA/GET3 family ATPase
MTGDLHTLVADRHVIVCCGTGGVGKTTVSAVLALGAARAGRDAVVVTIDPAKRLADTLGLAELGNIAHEIPRARWDADGTAAPGGRLSALMLDTRSTFDALVLKFATDADQAGRILDNRFYRNIAGALSGTQEYMAMEKLHELHSEGGHDLIVIDTPPTRHALDFLDAPARLTRLLDNRVFRFLMLPTRTYLRAAGVAIQAFFRTVGRVVGTEVIDDAVAFFRAFEGMEQGFRERAADVTDLMASPDTAFVLVTSPRQDAVDEAEFFAERLRESKMDVSALVVNRVHPDFGEADEVPALWARRDQMGALAASAADASARAASERLATRYRNLADYATLGARERAQLARTRAAFGTGIVTFVPSLSHDVVDFAALDAVAQYLAPTAPPTAPAAGSNPPEDGR